MAKVKEIQSVYDEVAERDYCDLVQQRQEDDWIVDDDGSGYVEDGREIFDEEANEDELASKKKKFKGDARKHTGGASGLDQEKPAVKSRNIKNMFMAGSAKQKVKSEKKLDQEGGNVLEDILGELKNPKISPMVAGGMVRVSKSVKHRPVNPFATKLSGGAKYVALPRTQQAPTPTVTTTPKRWASLPVNQPGRSKGKTRGAVKTADEDLEELDNVDYMNSQPDVKVGTNEILENKPDVDRTKPEMMLEDINFEDGAFEESSSAEARKIDDQQLTEIDSVAPTKVDKRWAPEEKKWETGWEVCKSSTDDINEANDRTVTVQVDSLTLPTVTNESGDEVLRMFWLDAYEDPFKQTGTVYMFGKVWLEASKTYISCCLIIKNIERQIFLLPKDDMTFQDVYNEFNDKYATEYHIRKFKCKRAKKYYAFEKFEVPSEADYLEVKYSHDFPALPSNLCGNTFSHVFGTNTACLEMLLLDLKIKGPCWLDITIPQVNSPPLSWCKIEAVVSSPSHISRTGADLKPPPVVCLALTIRSAFNSSTHENEIVGVGCLLHNSFPLDKAAPKPPFQQHFSIITCPSGCVMPFDFAQQLKKSQLGNVEVAASERNLLSYLLVKIQNIDPDVIVTHNFFGFDIDLILKKMEIGNVPHWSRLGRLRRAHMPKVAKKGGHFGRMQHKSTVAGRLVVDMKISAQELIRCRSYDLTELVGHVLHRNRIEIPPESIHNMFTTSQSLLQLVECTMGDASYVLTLLCELNVLPLALQITNIAGNVLSRTLLGGRSERNEFLLLHAFHDKQFITPDKVYAKKQGPKGKGDSVNETTENGDETVATTKSKKKPSYAGGLVLEPKKGFYDKYVLLLDFNSLYPSIIQEYNICFTTVARVPYKETEEGLPDVEMPSNDLEDGVLPTEIRKLVESRRAVKALMKDKSTSAELMMQYDIRQKALKLTANSMYGCLGFSNSRFFAKHLAALTTGKGREILLHTKHLVQKYDLDVIYGDTDSIMINTNTTNLDEVFQIGNKVKTEVNRQYKKLELEVDGVFKSMLLLKKKKYAALVVDRSPAGEVTYSKELKGLDIVRRDWCDLSKDVGNYAIEQILSADTRENIVERIHQRLTEVADDMKQGKVLLEKFMINKALTKNPDDYPDKKSLPHVQVAMRLNSKGGKKLGHGDTITYIICQDGSGLPATQRAYHAAELRMQPSLQVDLPYYLASQLHPVVARLCDPIEGTDAGQIAQCLGLDASAYHRTHIHKQEDDMDASGPMSYSEKFKHCDPLTVRCTNPNCASDIIFEKVLLTDVMCSLETCPNRKCDLSPRDTTAYICNKLVQEIRKHLSKYYLVSMKHNSCS
ncbi:PREDICTED: DNA polymerase alpha catalytic subunit-like [Priapulus caudatus]|uniref:DNA polymerase n=1 Tax=Priapulus caudatus TaxID=37621 RepID=A0ABM1EAQ1_PRICU|nr:PREDICTED: DNA polymerase alpha catalytic subunit-like [Priapulus caudatus]